nr:unnamed protein product [Digitaria exilis]
MADALRRLRMELLDMQKPPPECSAGLINNDIFHWSATIHGPSDSPYTGGLFRLTMDFPQEYPHKAPVVKFKTKVYHPNIDSENGYVDVDILTEKWLAGMSVRYILMSIWQLLKTPDAETPVAQEIGGIYMKDPDKYNDIAKQWTQKYAKE